MNLLQLAKENNQKIYEEMRVKYVLNQLENLDFIERLAPFYGEGLKQAIKKSSSFQEVLNEAKDIHGKLSFLVEFFYTFADHQAYFLNYDEQNRQYSIKFDLVNEEWGEDIVSEKLTLYIQNGEVSTDKRNLEHNVQWHGEAPAIPLIDALMLFGNDQPKILRALKLAEELEGMLEGA